MYSTISIFKGLSLIVFPFFIQSYQLNCPELPQWKIRGYGHCNNSRKYTCLLDTNENTFNENCEFGLHFLGPGYKFVISGMLDIRQCGAERFQPLKLPSNTSSNCVMLKSQCNGEGQVDFSNGTTTHDRSCRCNYLNNFVFVTKPKATCYCVPSQEDCSCYYKACPVDHYLTPDYQCVHFSNLAGIFQCPEIQNEKKPKSVAPTKTIFTPKSIQDLHHWRLRAVITIFLMIFALLSLQGILIFHKKYRKLQEIANEKIMLKSEMLSTKHDTSTENSEISKGSTSLKKEELAESGKELIQSTLQNSISETENNLENMKKHLSLAKDVFSKSGKHKTVSTLVETRPLKLLKKHIVEKDYFCVIGVSGSGKSVILYQIADEMYNKEGYQIVTANKPSEVLEKNNDYRKQLFVFDDVCGKFTFDPTLADSWNLLSARIRKLLKENKTKLIFSCRSNISKEQMYQAVSILAENTCDMQSSEFSMTSEDNNQIAKYFLTENDVDRLKTTDDFKTNKSIPLLCNLYSIFRNEETDVVHFFSNAKKILKDKIDFIANNPTCSTMFFFFVISNNNLSEKFVQDNKWIIAEIGESNISVEEIINAIQHNLLFVKKKYANFFVCHDMVFDVLVSSVSQRRLNEILKFACADLLCERSHFESIGLGPDYGCIKIPFDKEGLYFERLYSGFKKYPSFQNRQLKFKSYRKKFILIVLENLYLPKLILANDISPFLISTFQGFSDVVYALLKISSTSIVNITDKVGRTALYIAAEFNDIHTGTVLLNGKCDLNISRKDKYHEGETPLHIAAFKSNLRFVQLLIENHVDIDQLNVMQMTALHISCTKDDKNLVKYLLDNGANPNIPNTKMNTPLHTAVAKGNTVIVKFLINHESDLKKPNQDGESPLYLAVSKGHVVVVDMLLKASRSIVNVNYEYMYPLYFAAREGFYEIVKLLLDSGADPDSCALLEKSPLYVALEMGHFEIAKYLLQKKANANLYMYGGFTPIYVSSLKGYTKIVELLLRNNADPNICTSEKLSPLYVACIKGHSEIVEILLNKHANISLSDINNRSPLYVASREGHLNIVKLLLDHKADPNQATVVNRTPLFIATLEGQTDIVRHLLLKNANVNIATADRETPLLVASREGHTDIVKLLIDNGADINQATVANRSIFVAASKGHTNIVHYLLNKNANVNIATVDRETLLLFASREGHTDIVKLLIDNGEDPSEATVATMNLIFESALQEQTNIVPLLHLKNTNFNNASLDHKIKFVVVSRQQHFEIIRLLIDHGADQKQSTVANIIPIFEAVSERHTNNVWYLLKNNANFNIDTIENDTPLFVATREGLIEIVKLMEDHGADPKQDIKDNITPILVFVAASEVYRDVVRYLLQNNADFNIPTGDHKSQLTVAYRKGYTNIVKLLIDHSSDQKQATAVNRTPVFEAASEGHTDNVRHLHHSNAHRHIATSIVGTSEGHFDIENNLKYHTDVNE